MRKPDLKNSKDGDFFSDDQQKGLEFRHRGKSRVFSFYYRSPVTGRQRRMKIGNYGFFFVPEPRPAFPNFLFRS